MLTQNQGLAVLYLLMRYRGKVQGEGYNIARAIISYSNFMYLSVHRRGELAEHRRMLISLNSGPWNLSVKITPANWPNSSKMPPKH
jgi:hypothetical protein